MVDNECSVTMETIHDWQYNEKNNIMIPNCNDLFLKTLGKRRSSSQELRNMIKNMEKLII